MKQIVTVWGANFAGEDELGGFVQTGWDDDGEAVPSLFMRTIGTSRIDEDFMEVHYVGREYSLEAFADYLRSEYRSDDMSFAERLPANLEETLGNYNSFIVVYGNDSGYGAVNDELFTIGGRPEGSAAALLLRVVF